jgi:hypothetical protein
MTRRLLRESRHDCGFLFWINTTAAAELFFLFVDWKNDEHFISQDSAVDHNQSRRRVNGASYPMICKVSFPCQLMVMCAAYCDVLCE